MSRQSPRVVLVYPPNQLMAVEIPRPDGSLGPLYLAGALRAAGIEVHLLDASVGAPEDNLANTFHNRVAQPNGLVRIGMTPERIREYFAHEQFDVVAISSNFTPQTKMALEVAALAREAKPDTLVIAGGVNARALAQRFLSTGLVDIIALSEAEKTIVQIVQTWQSNQGFAGLSGVIYYNNGQILTNPTTPATYHTNLDDLPFPAWDLLQFAKYDEINSPHGAITPGARRRYAPIMTSRGCPFRCAYCHVSMERSSTSLTGSLGTLRLKSIDRVMQEFEAVRQLGVTHVYFEDDSLLAKKARVMEIFSRLAGLGLKISNVNGVNLVHFGVPSEGGRLHPDHEYLEAMVAAGFNEIVFPVESGSQRVLDKYATGKLRHDKLDVVELMQAAVAAGITAPVNMMIGFPDETETEMAQSIELAKRLIGAGAPYVTFFIPIPFPGSQLYHYALKHGHLGEDFDPDTMNWKHAVMQNTVVPPQRIVEIRDQAWEQVNSDAYRAGRIAREIRTRVAATE